MSLYGGRPGKPFHINKVFTKYQDMYNEVIDQTDPYQEDKVPIGAYVLINYGNGINNSQDSNYQKNRKEELEWLAENPLLVPGDATSDYPYIFFWKDIKTDSYDFNNTIWIKVSYEDNGEIKFKYNFIGNIGIIPNNVVWTS